MKYKIYSMARVGSTNFKITKITGYAKETDVVDDRMKKLKTFCRKRTPRTKEVNRKFAIQAFGDLQTAEESVENLDKILVRFFGNYFLYFA